MKTNKQNVFLGASVLSAIVASLCCIGPLLAVVLGVSGLAAASAFAKWRPLFLLGTFALLGLAWYWTYRKSKQACAEGAACATKPVGKWNKIVLWVATVLVALVAAFPLYSGVVTRLLQPGERKADAAGSSSLATLTVKVSGMHCAGCAAGIEAALQKLPGIHQAAVSFDTKQAVVEYDPQTLAKDAIIAAINQNGFQAEAQP